MSDSANLSSLLGDAGLDASATAAMELTADTLGPAIMAGLGDVSLDDVSSSEAVLVRMLLDDSSSIAYVPGNPEAVRIGGNEVVEALAGSKQSADVLIGCDLLNRGVFYAYRPLAGAVKLDNSNYNPSGGTPLYREAAVTLTSVAAKVAQFEAGGVAVRAITVIVTDGEDSTYDTPDNVRAIVQGLLKTEQHIVAAIGIDDGHTDFRQIFADMGIPDTWILTPGNSPSEIRKAFAVVSQSAVRASQSAGSFSQTALGGFGG
ncbi:MAG TPA: hypothetical protein VMT23_03410 [Candidatus Binatia bacterium]|nr:hypothetical protein [Candidatus Binatia bacterium]